jgi:hypothetical protein
MGKGRRVHSNSAESDEVDESISRKIEDAVKKCFQDDAFGNTLLNTISEHLSRTLSADLREAIKELKTECASLKKELDECKKELKSVKSVFTAKIDEAEQYSRRNNLRVYGVPEKHHEDSTEAVIQLAKEKLDVDISKFDIDRCHRLGKQDAKKNSPRPIIVRFSTYRMRSLVFRNKRLLKNTGITIKEDLTVLRRQLMRDATEVFGLKCVWSLDGNIKYSKEGRTFTASVNDTFK